MTTETTPVDVYDYPAPRPAHLGALLKALCEEERTLASMAADSLPDALGEPPSTSVQIIDHQTKSGLCTDVLRLHADTLQATALPYEEHVSRNGHLVLQLHRVTPDAPLLASILAALQRDELRLRKGRQVFMRAASGLMMMKGVGGGGVPARSHISHNGHK